MKINNSSTDNTLREQQLFSHGKILSSFSHELNNHIAIIRESAGLLQDYIEIGKIDDQDLQSKLEIILDRVEERVDAIKAMTSRLNRFSHRFDTPRSQFDLAEIVEEQLFFLKRYARLKKISVELVKDAPVTLTNSPGLIQYVIFYLYTRSLEWLGEDSTITIRVERSEPSVFLHFHLEGQANTEELTSVTSVSPEIAHCLTMMDAKIPPVSTDPDGRICMTLKINCSDT